MRLFYAIELTDNTRGQITALIQQLQQSGWRGRFSRPENLHLTLQFLGEYPPYEVEELGAILMNVTANIPPFQMQIENGGSFGRNSDTIWLGISGDNPLQEAASGIAKGLEAKKLPFVHRPFHPHITIGRNIRFPDQDFNEVSWPRIVESVKSISLMQSRQESGRLVYSPICRYDLQGESCCAT